MEKMPTDADYGGVLVKILLKFGHKLLNMHVIQIFVACA